MLARADLKYVTLSRRLRMDCETPVSLYLKLAAVEDYAFILESVEQGQYSGRFSFVGWQPLLHFTYSKPHLNIAGDWEHRFQTDQPLALLGTLLEDIQMLDPQTTPNARGGLVGYFGYDAVRLKEDIGPYRCDDEMPWIDLILPHYLIVFDHLNHEVNLLCHRQVQDGEAPARAAAAADIEKLLAALETATIPLATHPAAECLVDLGTWTSNMSREAYCRMVERAKQHIFEGDIFQVVLSRIIRKRFPGNPFEIYRALRQVNPSPYMFFLKQGQRVVVGSSPEALVSLDQGELTTKPIAGTRPRAADLETDLRLEKELLADEKEIAEHLMLVDLGRNDLGRIAEVGTVSVPRFMQIERFSHVMHIVSVVRAKLKAGIHPFEALMSVFPAGTLSGAPKIRAMQIINEFEPETRGVYGGAIGFLDFSGNMDSCIAIRTAVVENGWVRIQAGAGIVADSQPAREYDETTQKLMGMVLSVEKALAAG